MGKRRNKKQHNMEINNTSTNVENSINEEIENTSEKVEDIVEKSETTNVDVDVNNNDGKNEHVEDSENTSESNAENNNRSEVEPEENKEEQSELSEKQLEDLENIRNKIDKEIDNAEGSAQNIKNIYSYFKKVVDWCDENRALCGAIFIFFVTLFWLLLLNNMNSKDRLPDVKVSTSSETVLSVSMNSETNLLDFSLGKLCIETNYTDKKTKELITQYITINNFNWIRGGLNTDIDTYNIDGVDFVVDKNLSLNEFIITEQYGYISYNNSEDNGAKELIFSNIKPLNIDTTNIQKLSSRAFEYVTPVNIQSYVNSYNNSFLMTREVIGGGKLNIDTLIPQLKAIENSAVISDNFNGIRIIFNELGNYVINNSEDKNIGLMYKDGILVIKDMINDVDLMYVTSIDNQIIGCYKESLIKTTSEGIFVTTGFNDEQSNLYRTVAIKTDNNLYVIKFVDEETEKDFCEQLGIDLSNLMIDNVQEIIKENN